MTRVIPARVPPRLATWLLEHLGTRYRTESLVGDLFEEYQQDRTRAWYWRQTAAALLVGRVRSLRMTIPKFILTALLRVLIELGVVLGGIALAESKAACTAHSSTCDGKPAPLRHSQVTGPRDR
jgi:hypothetical protein